MADQLSKMAATIIGSRQLPGKTRVLKLVRSWGAEHAQDKLIMKRIENLNENVGDKSEDSSLSTEDNKYFNIQNKIILL